MADKRKVSFYAGTILLGKKLNTYTIRNLFNLQKITSKTTVHTGYGMSEVGGLSIYDDLPARGSAGRLLDLFDYRVRLIVYSV